MKWGRDLQCDLEWEEVYKRFQGCTKNTTLLWFQDKIIHRILTTNVFVSKFTNESPLCTFCKRHRETLLHLFFFCEEVQCIWECMERLIRNRLQVTVTLNKVNVLLGIANDTQSPIDAEKALAIQRAILLAKYYIYRTRVARCKISTTEMLAYLEFNTQAEFRYDKGQKSIRKRNETHKLLSLPSM